MTDADGKITQNAPGTFNWRDCPNPYKVVDLDSGEYSFQVRPGSEGPVTASCEFKVWLPEIKVTSAYPSPSSSQIQQFDFDLPGWVATAECHLSQVLAASDDDSTAWLVGFPS